MDLALLAQLIKQRNALEVAISGLILRPATLGNLGEAIAAEIFDLELVKSGSNRAYDGWFRQGVLAGRNVNVKWYARQESLLDLTPDELPEFYLAMIGPRPSAADKETRTRSWLIHSVHLFESHDLFTQLNNRGVYLGLASSIRKALWDAAEIYPKANNPLLVLNAEQRQALALFSGDNS